MTNQEKINSVKTSIQASITFNPNSEKQAMLAVIRTIGRKATGNYVSGICDSVSKYGKCSEKQAYCIARFFVENENNLDININQGYFSLY
jgi:hypothetical protein